MRAPGPGRLVGMALLAVLGAGCAAPPVAPLPVVATATQPLNTAVTTPAAATPTSETPTTPAPPPTNDRGNVALALGEPAVGRVDDRDAGWTVTVTDVAVGAPCPEQATRGQLLVATVRLDTTPDYDTALPAPPAAADLTVVAPDAVVTGDLVTDPARTCDPGVERAPVAVQADTGYTFAVVLDSPVATGNLAFRPAGSAQGWEWAFPRA